MKKTSGMLLYPQMVHGIRKQWRLPVGIDRFWVLFKCENLNAALISSHFKMEDSVKSIQPGELERSYQ